MPMGLHQGKDRARKGEVERVQLLRRRKPECLVTLVAAAEASRGMPAELHRKTTMFRKNLVLATLRRGDGLNEHGECRWDYIDGRPGRAVLEGLETLTGASRGVSSR
jgi:hypothetical protein